MVNGGITYNLTYVIEDNVLQYEGLLEFNLVSKLICFGANGVSVFQGAKSDVTTQVMEKFTPYMLGVHLWCTLNNSFGSNGADVCTNLLYYENFPIYCRYQILEPTKESKGCKCIVNMKIAQQTPTTKP